MPMRLAVPNPNFTILMPGGCNASCAFCFWCQKVELDLPKYIIRMQEVLDRLPLPFNQCSISGGEPLISKALPYVLGIVRPRFEKVVLSTNGTDFSPDVCEYVDHINLSRHAVHDDENRQIFGTSSVPSVDEVASLCRLAEKYGVDVTINCVLQPREDDLEKVEAMVRFSKDVGARQICFRKQATDDLDPLPVEERIDSPILHETSCPACRSNTRQVQGMLTMWKYGLDEPVSVMQDIYELIFHTDGELTKDWAGKHPVKLPDKKQQRTTVPTMPAPGRLPGSNLPSPSTGGGGCNGGMPSSRC